MYAGRISVLAQTSSKNGSYRDDEDDSTRHRLVLIPINHFKKPPPDGLDMAAKYGVDADR